MEGQLQCAECGHELSLYEPPMPSRGERAASWFAAHLAGWWVPVAIVTLVLIWAVWNALARPFEPHPVIIFAAISGVLSTVAAIQGPLILLAQRRAAMNDRARDEETYRIATNSEADLHTISAKLDQVLDRVGALEALPKR
jgi:uncharacterized membrane protein